MSKYFDSMIGQEPLKARLDFYMDAYEQTGVFPNTMFIAQKGDGKSSFARLVANTLREVAMKKGHKKMYAEINCAGIDDDEKFITRLMASCQQNVHATIFLDEFHALPRKVVDWLLSVLETGKLVNIVEYNGQQCSFDFRKLTFIAATTERQRVFAPLMNRFRILELAAYEPVELGRILLKNTDNITIDDAIVRELATLSRGNGRSIVDLAIEVVRYARINNVTTLTQSDYEQLVKILDVFPLGLSRAEVVALLTLRQRGELSLTAFCAVSGLTKPAQQATETYMMKHGLLEIRTNSKRVLTAAGFNYLNKIVPEEHTDADSIFS